MKLSRYLCMEFSNIIESIYLLHYLVDCYLIDCPCSYLRKKTGTLTMIYLTYKYPITSHKIFLNIQDCVSKKSSQLKACY